MTPLVLVWLNAVLAAANIGMYAAWHHPWGLGVGIFCGFAAFLGALREI